MFLLFCVVSVLLIFLLSSEANNIMFTYINNDKYNYINDGIINIQTYRHTPQDNLSIPKHPFIFTKLRRAQHMQE